MATWPHISAKNKTDVLQGGLHASSEGGAGFTSRGSRSTGGRASRTTLTQTSCVKGGTHSEYLLYRSVPADISPFRARIRGGVPGRAGFADHHAARRRLCGAQWPVFFAE